jgi:ornithine cyclodeaminase
MKTNIFTLDQIKSAINIPELINSIEEGFILYSNGKVVAPPVGHLEFPKTHGDVHIKYGYIKDDKYFVIKVASGFYDNPKIGLSSSNGLMHVFSQQTGELLGILLDEGYLTDIRTAVAGAIVAKYLAPKAVKKIGIVGTGIQAHLQLEFLQYVTTCKDVIVYGRHEGSLAKYKKDMEEKGFHVITTHDTNKLTSECNLIVTTTPSTKPILSLEQIQKGTHITAMGADSKGKQELDSRIMQKANILVADSIEQCADHGELSHALKENLISKDKLVELGNVIENTKLRRQSDNEITIADLTGVAVQDIQIAKYVYIKLHASNEKQ